MSHTETVSRLAMVREAVARDLRQHQDNHHRCNGNRHSFLNYLEGCMDTEKWIVEQLDFCLNPDQQAPDLPVTNKEERLR